MSFSSFVIPSRYSGSTTPVVVTSISPGEMGSAPHDSIPGLRRVPGPTSSLQRLFYSIIRYVFVPTRTYQRLRIALPKCDSTTNTIYSSRVRGYSNLRSPLTSQNLGCISSFLTSTGYLDVYSSNSVALLDPMIFRIGYLLRDGFPHSE